MTVSARATHTTALYQLDNGLSLLVVPVVGAPAVATCLHVDTGCRNEPRAGAAHLLEHVLATPSEAELPLLDEMYAMGGRSNARTALDYTQYTHFLPPGGLELALAREAARLARRSAPEALLAEQVQVVRAEIRRNVLQRPHGGLVMHALPDLLHDRWADAHNGYGDLAAIGLLDRDLVDDVLAEVWVPNRAVLAVVGDVDPDAVLDLAGPLGELPRGRHRPERAPGAPDSGAPRRACREDPLAADHRSVFGFRVADPRSAARTYLATALLGEVLDGHPDLLAGHGLPPGCRWRVSRTGNPFDLVGPSLLAVTVPHGEADEAEAIEARLRVALSALGSSEALPGAVDLTARHTQLALLGDLDSVVSLASWSAVGLDLFDDAGHQLSIAHELTSVTADEVATVAAQLAGSQVACLTSTGRHDRAAG